MCIKVNSGLRQGCGLSPLLFDIYINKILEEWKSTEPRGIYLGRNKEIKTILFADDQVLLTSNEDDLQYNVTKLNNVLKGYNMEISGSKTKVLAMEGKSMRRAKIVIDGQNIEQVKTFKYLGCNITNHQINLDLEENIQKYNRTNGIIRSYFGRNMTKEVQIRFHNVLSKPALLYGSETWTIRAQDRKRIETAQMRFLRSVEKVTLRDKKKSSEIRDKLKVKNITNEIKDYQKNWQCHVERMAPDRLPRQAYFYQPFGKRDLGRPRKRWKDAISLGTGQQ